MIWYPQQIAFAPTAETIRFSISSTQNYTERHETVGAVSAENALGFCQCYSTVQASRPLLKEFASGAHLFQFSMQKGIQTHRRHQGKNDVR